MAALTTIGLCEVQMANAQKNWLATIITTISVAVFSIAVTLAGPQTLAVLLGALGGGYGGARLARLVPARLLQVVVILVSLSLSAYYFAA